MPNDNVNVNSKEYVNGLINNIIIKNKDCVEKYEVNLSHEEIEDLINIYFNNIKNGKSSLESFIEILYVNNIVTGEQLKTIPDLVHEGISFIPSTSKTNNGADYCLSLKLLISKKVKFDEIKFINGNNTPLKYENIKQDIYDGKTTLEQQRYEFHKILEIESACHYKKLRKSIENQINRIREDGGVEKANKLAEYLLSIDEKFKRYHDQRIDNGYRKKSMSRYEFLLKETNENLMAIFDEKRYGNLNYGHTKSYELIKESISEIQVDFKKFKRRKEAVPIKPLAENLGLIIIKLLMSRKEESINSVFDCIKNFSLSQRIDFINVYHRVFQPDPGYKTRFNGENSQLINCFVDNIARNLKKNENKDHALQFDKWFEVINYTLAPDDSRFDNAFNCPIVNFERDEIDKEVRSEKLSQAASFNQLMFQAEKMGGSHSVGEFGGIYLRHYLQSGKLCSQQSLIKQANENGTVNLLDNMREAWGGFIVNSLAPNNHASISLITKPCGKNAVPEDVYVESQYHDDFISAHQAAHEGLEEIPTRAKAKYCGQLINDEFMGNPEFQEGIKQYVSENEVDMASLARAMIPCWLAGDTQRHTENVGFAKVNGKVEFVSIDYGGAGRRPFSDSTANLKMEEMDVEFSSEIFPFKGRGNKLGACYARAYPLEFYLEDSFIQEAKKILEEAKHKSSSIIHDNINRIKSSFGDEAYDQFSASFGKSGQLNATNFEEFIIVKNSDRIRSLENFVMDLQLWKLIKDGDQTKIKNFFNDNPSFKFPYVSDIDGTKGEFTSKNLRVLFKEDGSNVSPEFISNVVDICIEQKSGKQEITGNLVKRACSLYQKEKDLKKGRYNPFRKDSTLFKELSKWTLKREEHAELDDKDKLELMVMIHKCRTATAVNSASRKPALSLLKTLCPIEGDYDGSVAFKLLTSIAPEAVKAFSTSANGFDDIVNYINNAAQNRKTQENVVDRTLQNHDSHSTVPTSAYSNKTVASSTRASRSHSHSLSTPLLRDNSDMDDCKYTTSPTVVDSLPVAAGQIFTQTPNETIMYFMKSLMNMMSSMKETNENVVGQMSQMTEVVKNLSKQMEDRLTVIPAA